MSFDAFMWLETPNSCPAIEGETTDATFSANKAFEIMSFSWGASNPSSVGSGTIGSGSGKVSLSSFNIMKTTDNCSPSLFLSCCNGGHYGKATVILRKAGGDAAATGKEYLKYEFAEVFIDSVQWSGSSGGDDRPMESLSVSFGACQVTYSPQAATGSEGTDNIVAWSVVLNNNTLAVS